MYLNVLDIFKLGIVELIIALLLLVIITVIPFYFWFKHTVRLSKKEDKSEMWICLLIGLFFTPLVGWVVGSLLEKEK